METILREVRGINAGYQLRASGRKVCLLAFADDIMLVSASREEMLRIDGYAS